MDKKRKDEHFLLIWIISYSDANVARCNVSCFEVRQQNYHYKINQAITEWFAFIFWSRDELTRQRQTCKKFYFLYQAISPSVWTPRFLKFCKTRESNGTYLVCPSASNGFSVILVLLLDWLPNLCYRADLNLLFTYSWWEMDSLFPMILWKTDSKLKSLTFITWCSLLKANS